jgi:hypothetical protein
MASENWIFSREYSGRFTKQSSGGGVTDRSAGRPGPPHMSPPYGDFSHDGF